MGSSKMVVDDQGVNIALRFATCHLIFLYALFGAIKPDESTKKSASLLADGGDAAAMLGDGGAWTNFRGVGGRHDLCA